MATGLLLWARPLLAQTTCFGPENQTGATSGPNYLWWAESLDLDHFWRVFFLLCLSVALVPPL